MSDNQNQDNTPFQGIEKIDEFERQRILDEAQVAVDRVNFNTQQAITAAKEEQCSQAVAQALHEAGRITQRQRMQIIARVRKSYGFGPFKE